MTSGEEMDYKALYEKLKRETEKKQKIVYPTDPENHWLRIIDQNKEENDEHRKKFEADKTELNKLKSKAMDDIHSCIKQLRAALEDRQDQLEAILDQAFKEREDKIEANMQSLEDHRRKNVETKDNSEDLLMSDKPRKEREKQIVSDCENVINTTPNIRYIETELRFTFTELDRIKRKIEDFGKLHTKEIGTGQRCIFKSTKDAKGAPSTEPKVINVDEIVSVQLRKTSFDDDNERVLIGFKVKKEGECPDIDIMKHLSITIICSPDNDDEKVNDSEPIHQETVKLSDCKSLSKDRYELSVNKKFTGGMTVEFRMKAKFVTPDEEKFASSEGKWSREQVYEIPEDETSVTFKLELNGKQRELEVNDDDEALTNFDEFTKKFLNKYNKKLQPGETIIFVTSDGVLNEKTLSAKYASDEYTIKGHINAAPQPEQSPPAAYSQPSPKAVSPKAVSPKAKSPRIAEAAPGAPGANIADRPLPKQISFIAVYSGQKKRVILKNNPKKNQMDYKMDILRGVVEKKFKSKGLSGHYDLQTDKGQKIQMNDDIINYLADYKGEIQVIQ